MLYFTFSISCHKYITSLKLRGLGSPFNIRKWNLWSRWVYYITQLTSLSIKHPNLTILTCSCYILILLVKLTAVYLSIRIPQTETVINLYWGLRVMFYGLGIRYWSLFFYLVLFLLRLLLTFTGFVLLLHNKI